MYGLNICCNSKYR